jgi:hypothetical protein
LRGCVAAWRIDLGTAKAGEVLNRFQEVDKIPGFVLQMPQVAFDAGNGVVSLLFMLYNVGIGLATLVAVCGAVEGRCAVHGGRGGGGRGVG